MKTKTNLSGFGDALGKIIQQYSDDVCRDLPEVVEDAAKFGVKTLKSKAKGAVGGTGKYTSSFKQKTTGSSSSSTEITIYSDRYQVAHLLEHGHVIKNQYGVYGVTAARPHWAPAEQEAIEKLEELIQKKVEEAG